MGKIQKEEMTNIENNLEKEETEKENIKDDETSFQEELRNTNEQTQTNKNRIFKLEESIKKTQIEFDRIRGKLQEKFGLPPLIDGEKIPSNASNEAENTQENTQTVKEKISPDKLLEESTDTKKEEIKK